MYNFYYNFLKPWYPDGKVRLLYTDTDSFILEFLTDDIYDDMQSNLNEYNTSKYSSDHRLHSQVYKKVVGKFKDELGGKLMTEFVGLRSKLYSYTGEESGKRAKGVNRVELEKTITHDDYLECLREQRVFLHDMPGSGQTNLPNLRKFANFPLPNMR